MVTTTKVTAFATAAVLAMTPATALARTHHAKSHHGAKAVCAAQKKQMGVKAFDAKYGTGTTHKRAMANCIRQHATTTKKKKTSTSG